MPETASELATRLRERGVTLRLRNNRLWLLPAKAYRELSEEDQAQVRALRAELKALVNAAGGVLAARDALAASSPSSDGKPLPAGDTSRLEPEPEVYVGRYRVTNADVLETLRAAGDEALRDYETGQLSKAEAFEMARVRVRQMKSLGWRTS